MCIRDRVSTQSTGRQLGKCLSSILVMSDTQHHDGGTPITQDVFTIGIMRLLKPVVTECDTRIKGVFQSQSDLSAQIDRLSEELEKFMDLSKTPALAPYVQKLVNARNRLNNINVTLSRIMDRLTNIQNTVENENR
eukprot:TRINITY_DN1277_c0_g2_i1.p1 TRINITY_DN1277_c0_g2~~TRINITY_DN1277_c0_g2_i1.p1  ORF type:complete len:136 (-),score=24.97 TRINITY_DN1277_c0_g2_i1:136-543(-)